MKRLLNIRLIWLPLLGAIGVLAAVAPLANAGPNQARVNHEHQDSTTPDPSWPSQDLSGIDFLPPESGSVDIPVPPGLENPPSPPSGGSTPDNNPPATPAAPQVQAPAVQTTTTTTATPTAATPQVVTTPTTTTSGAVTTTTEATPAPQSPPAPPPKPTPKCLNHPDWADIPGGWRRNGDGTCSEIPKVDLQLSGPSTLSAPNGTVSFTVNIVNAGSNMTTGVLFKDQLAGNLVPTSMTDSDGDKCVYDDDLNVRRIICSVGTIEGANPNTGKPNSKTVSITLKVSGPGKETAMVEPGGESETNTDDNFASATITPVNVQTLQLVQQHGLQWGGHYYGSVQDFARVLAREGINWRGWKNTHSALADGLIAHDRKLSWHR